MLICSDAGSDGARSYPVDSTRRTVDNVGFAKLVRTLHSGEMHLVLLGAPGAGKGTQSAVLANHFGLTHVSSGALLREQVKAGTEFGLRVSGLLDRGELVPDELIFAVIREVLITAVNGYVLDGIPRNLAQAKRADELALPGETFADAVVYLDVSDDIVRERLTHRSGTSRVDDHPTVVEHRLEVFHAAMHPLLDYYRDRDILETVDGSGPADTVTSAILEALSTRGLR